MTEGEVIMCHYVIYLNPADLHPGYAVREWCVVAGRPAPVAGAVLAQGLPGVEWARQVVPGWADSCFDRGPNDDPAIVETWL